MTRSVSILTRASREDGCAFSRSGAESRVEVKARREIEPFDMEVSWKSLYIVLEERSQRKTASAFSCHTAASLVPELLRGRRPDPARAIPPAATVRWPKADRKLAGRPAMDAVFPAVLIQQVPPPPDRLPESCSRRQYTRRRCMRADTGPHSK